jgi:hypothetical protein
MCPRATAAPSSTTISPVAIASRRTDFLVDALLLLLPDTAGETNTKSGSRLLNQESVLPSTDQARRELLGLCG